MTWTETKPQNKTTKTTFHRDTTLIRTLYLNSRSVQKRLGKEPVYVTERLRGSYMSTKNYRITNYRPKVYNLSLFISFLFLPRLGNVTGLQWSRSPLHRTLLPPSTFLLLTDGETDVETLVFVVSHYSRV